MTIISLPRLVRVLLAAFLLRPKAAASTPPQLEPQAFRALNLLLSQTELRIPRRDVSRGGIDIAITELVCRDIGVEDVQVRHSFVSSAIQRVGAAVLGLGALCTFRWEYSWTMFRGKGSGLALIENSTAQADLDFRSDNYEAHPPSDVSFHYCQRDGIQVTNMDFEGEGLGLIAGVMNTFESLLRDTISEEIGGTACDELIGLGDDALDDLLLFLSSQIDTYMEPLSLDFSDPLFLENNMNFPKNGSDMPVLVNFQQLDEIAGGWIHSALDQLDFTFGGSDSPGVLAVNDLIRGSVLDEEGLIVVDPSLISNSGKIFDGHDVLTETTMLIKSVKIGGLDTFQSIDLLNPIGKYTLQNTLKLGTLSIILEIEAIMKASSLSDAVIVAPDAPAIEESFIIDLTLNDIELDFSILLGINSDKLGNLHLESILRMNDVIECILSAVDEAAFTGLSISVSDITPPILTGFLDEGIDHIVSSGAVALFHMYENVLINAMPNFFQIYVRGLVNEYLKNTLVVADECPSNDVSMSGFVDFRDLLLSPEEAKLAGGSGTSPYGNLLSFVMSWVDKQLFSADEDGMLGINDVLVRPVTKWQSGREGSLKVNGTLIVLTKDEVIKAIWSAFAESIKLELSNLHISGIDTFREPVKVLEPMSISGYHLENQLSLGISDSSSVSQKGIDVSIEIGLVIGGDASPLSMNNVVELQLSIPPVELLAIMHAKMQESRLLEFPLEDIWNIDCWLSTFTKPKKASDGISEVRTSNIEGGLDVELFDLLVDGVMTANASCVSCSNSMLEDLNSIIDFLHGNGFTTNIQSRMISIMSGIFRGGWVKGMIDNKIESASRRCPHDPNYRDILPELSSPSFQVSRDVVDGILYGGFTLVQVIAIVVANKHMSIELPSARDMMLDVPDNAQLIDFTNLTSIVSWAHIAFEGLRGHLGSETESEYGSSVPGIVNVLHSLVLDDEGRLTVSIKDEGFETGGVKVSLYDVTLVGLDSFTKFDILDATSPQLLKNKIRVEKIGVILRMGVMVLNTPKESSGLSAGSGLNGNEPEVITVSLTLKDAELDFSLLLAIDQEILGNLELGSILNTNQILSCIFSAIYDAALPELVMNVGDIEEFSVSGFMTNETRKEIEEITEAIFGEYKSIVLSAIPAFTSTTVRTLLDNILGVMVDEGKSGECPEPSIALGGIVDFRDLLLSEAKAAALLGRGDSPYGNLFRSIYSFIEESTLAMNEDVTSLINDVVIAKLTRGQSDVEGDLHFPGDFFYERFDISFGGLDAEIAMGVSDIRISNLDSLGAPIKLFQPMKGESSVLNNTGSIGVGTEALRTSFKLLISGYGKDVQVYNEVDLSLSLRSLDIMVELLAQVKEAPLVNFPLQDASNFNCWLATMVAPALDKYGVRIGEAKSGIVLRRIALAVAEARLDMKCLSCSSNVLVQMSSQLLSVEGVADTTSVANMVFEYVSDILGGDFIQNQLDQMLNEAALKCPHNEAYNPNFLGLKYKDLIAPEQAEDSYGFLIAIICVISVIGVFSGVIFLTARCVSKRRHDQWMGTLTRPQILELEREQREERNREKDVNRRMRSLFWSNEIPCFLRLVIPMIILGNIGLFLSGHLSLGGTVNISGVFAGQEFDVEGFFEFSMVNSTIEMWEAGAKVLAVLIAIFSGMWPYIKQLITLYMWFVPPTIVSVRFRGKVLSWLDVLGKWSMIDVFVLLMSLASFQISVKSPDHLAFIPDSLYGINMVVVPLWGLYANMLAQFVSQVSSHVIIHYHRKTLLAATHAQEVEWGIGSLSEPDRSRKVLRRHTFRLDYEASSKRASIYKEVHWALISSMLLFVILVICGCSLPSFSLEVLGLVGIAVESGQQFEEAKVHYSVFSLAKMLMDEGRYLDTTSDLIGLGTLSSLLVITVLIVPLAQMLSLLLQWCWPMNKEERERNSVANEILSAWQYMEVYVLAIVIAAWQLGGVSEFMINAYCDPLNELFTSLAFYGILDERDAQCFKADARVDGASWLLVSASILLFVLNHFISTASSQQVQDESIPTEQRLHSDRWLPMKESMATVVIDEEEEQHFDVLKMKMFPVSPRFTDYYYLVTRRSEEMESGEAQVTMMS